MKDSVTRTAANTIKPPDTQAHVRNWERLCGSVSLPSSSSAAISAAGAQNSVASTAPATAVPLYGPTSRGEGDVPVSTRAVLTRAVAATSVRFGQVF